MGQLNPVMAADGHDIPFVPSLDREREAPRVAVLTPPPSDWQPSRYGGTSGKARVPALLSSALFVGGLLATFMAMSVLPDHKVVKPQRVVMALLSDPRTPPPPPPANPTPPKAEPIKVETPTSAIVVPEPKLTLVDKPATVVTSPAPPAEVVIPGPPAPAVPSRGQGVPSASSGASGPGPQITNAGDLSSKMIQANPPRYPQESRRKREQGTVVLALLLGVDGSVADISVARSSGFERLDRAALDAVRRWRWSPTRRDGAPVMVRGMVEIPFVLQIQERREGFGGHHRRHDAPEAEAAPDA